MCSFSYGSWWLSQELGLEGGGGGWQHCGCSNTDKSRHWIASLAVPVLCLALLCWSVSFLTNILITWIFLFMHSPGIDNLYLFDAITSSDQFYNNISGSHRAYNFVVCHSNLLASILIFWTASPSACLTVFNNSKWLAYVCKFQFGFFTS